MAPAPLTLVTYLLGYRAKLSQSTVLIKDSRAKALPMHADHSGKLPAPWPNISQYSVVTWVTTDYTRENGAVCVWPGSHRFGRPVPDDVVMDHDREEIEVLEMPKGSVIIWHGSLWHGAVPRTADGQRVTLVLPHVRPYSAPGNLLGDDDPRDDRPQPGALQHADGPALREPVAPRGADAGGDRMAAGDGVAVRVGREARRLQPRVHGLRLHRQHREDAFVDARQLLARDESRQGFEAQRKLPAGE